MVKPKCFDECFNELAPLIEKLSRNHDRGDVKYDHSFSTSYWKKSRYRFKFAHDILVRINGQGTILDIGCAPGYFTALLKFMGYDVMGVDSSPERNDSLYKHFELNILKCNIEKEKIHLPYNSVNFVFFLETLEHLFINPIHALAEIFRVVKVGGVLVVTTPNVCSLENRIKCLMGRKLDESILQAYKKLQDIGHACHMRLYTMDELEEMVEYSGFKIIENSYTNWRYYNKKTPVKSGFKKLFHKFFPSTRQQLVVVAKK